MAKVSASGSDYTPEEMLVLATLRKSSKRTCRYCTWYVQKGTQKGCFPNGSYRKWLSPEEFSSGCDGFAAVEKKP